METIGWGAVTFIAGLLAATIAQNILSRIWKRARPDLTIVDVDLGPEIGSESVPIFVGLALQSRFESSPILPDLPSEQTIASLEQYVSRARRVIEGVRARTQLLSSLLDRPHLLPPGVEAHEQRRRLLAEWARFPDLDNFAAGALRQFENESLKAASKCQVRSGLIQTSHVSKSMQMCRISCAR